MTKRVVTFINRFLFTKRKSQLSQNHKFIDMSSMRNNLQETVKDICTSIQQLQSALTSLQHMVASHDKHIHECKTRLYEVLNEKLATSNLHSNRDDIENPADLPNSRANFDKPLYNSDKPLRALYHRWLLQDLQDMVNGFDKMDVGFKSDDPNRPNRKNIDHTLYVDRQEHNNDEAIAAHRERIFLQYGSIPTVLPNTDRLSRCECNSTCIMCESTRNVDWLYECIGCANIVTVSQAAVAFKFNTCYRVLCNTCKHDADQTLQDPDRSTRNASF
jgi:hypothetical protein